MWRFFISVTGCLWLTASAALGADYYVSSTGNDANPGTSPGHAWKTIDRVNQGNYPAGSKILLEGGKQFPGSLLFTPDNLKGSAQSPVTLGSYGNGRATIATPAGQAGVLAANVAGLSIHNINFQGANAASGGSGISLVNEGKTVLAHLEVKDVEIAGYTYAMYVASTPTPSKLHGVRLERVVAHDNAAGPSFFGHYDVPAATVNEDYGIRGVYVGHSQFYKNTGAGLSNGFGGGLVLMNVADALIEHNVIHDNGGNAPEESPNGPSAITIYDGHKMMIQHNEIYRQRYSLKNQTDNAGMDVWATDSVIQYNYIHDNEGWGFIFGAGDPATGIPLNNWPSARNVVRYNILENNGRRQPDHPGLQPYAGATFLLFGLVRQFDIHHNTIYVSAPPSGLPSEDERNQGIFYLVDVPGPHQGSWEDIRVHGNVFIAAKGMAFIDVPRPQDGKGLRIENNAYLGGSGNMQVRWGGKTYASIQSWSDATSQERNKQGVLARLAGPEAVCAAGRGGALFPRPLKELKAYRLPQGSPLVNAASPLPSPGKDFFSNPVPTGPASDLGAHEQQPGEEC